MRVLVACEFSGVVRDAFRARGHDAWSCDLLPCESDPAWHFRGDITGPLSMPRGWDLVIAHPPCTDLAVSGARWFKEKQADGRQQASVDFFLRFVACAPRWCIENPIGIMSRLYRKPDQIIQPWQFGHGETKATCLWMDGLPPLVPTAVVGGAGGTNSQDAAVCVQVEAPIGDVQRDRIRDGRTMGFPVTSAPPSTVWTKLRTRP